MEDGDVDHRRCAVRTGLASEGKWIQTIGPAPRSRQNCARVRCDARTTWISLLERVVTQETGEEDSAQIQPRNLNQISGRIALSAIRGSP
jgi:hypothetical protein